jgi:hypothetical protein
MENGPQMGISPRLLPCHIPLVVEIRSLCKFAQCVVIPNNLQICFQAFSIIGIGHGWEGIVQYSFTVVLHNSSDASENGINYLCLDTTSALFHSSLVTCKK